LKKSNWSLPILLRQLIRNIGDFAGTCVPANQGNIALLSKKEKKEKKRGNIAQDILTCQVS